MTDGLTVCLRNVSDPDTNLCRQPIMVLKVFCRTMSADNRVCAERFIRPLAVERKYSLFFGSDKMAGVSAVYHTIISTCRMQGVSVLDYFKRFFSEIVKGRRGYEHLLPLTIGLEQ